MSRDKIIIAIGVILLAGVGVFFVAGMRTSIWLPQTRPQTTATSSISQITYDANGKIDTSGWQEYRSEYGGFSVRAPREVSIIGCFGHPCDPTVSGERFFYVLFRTYINEEIGEVGLSINVIKKK